MRFPLFIQRITLYARLLFAIIYGLSNPSIIYGNQNNNDKPPSPPLTLDHTFINPDFQDEEPSIRIKDITSVQGIRENFLVGRGLVVGLNGTGDSLASSPQTKESLVSMLERLGVNVRDGSISGKNVAMVMVTATLPPFSRSGSKIDVNVSALGDAKSLNGGTLVVTALKGADDQVYAVAQGNVSVSGIVAQGINAQQTKGVPTAGKIANGAIIEKEINYQFSDIEGIKLILTNPDFATAERIASTINIFGKVRNWGSSIAKAQDMGAVEINFPKSVDRLRAIQEIDNLEIRPDTKARVIIDENNGVIAMSSKTRISPIALTHGSITIKVVEEPHVYMPQTVIHTPGYPVVAAPASLEKIALQTQHLKTNQEEQKRILKDQHMQEIKHFDESNKELAQNNPTAFQQQKDQLASQHGQQLAQMDTRFAQQQQELQLKMTNQEVPVNSNETPDAGTGAVGAVGAAAALRRSNDAVTTVTTDLNVREEKGKFNLLSSGASIDKLVNALNRLGVTVKDMGAILMAIKNAGALHAEIKLS